MKKKLISILMILILILTLVSCGNSEKDSAEVVGAYFKEGNLEVCQIFNDYIGVTEIQVFDTICYDLGDLGNSRQFIDGIFLMFDNCIEDSNKTIESYLNLNGSETCYEAWNYPGLYYIVKGNNIIAKYVSLQEYDYYIEDLAVYLGMTEGWSEMLDIEPEIITDHIDCGVHGYGSLLRWTIENGNIFVFMSGDSIINSYIMIYN